jgi:hypothetical protein
MPCLPTVCPIHLPTVTPQTSDPTEGEDQLLDIEKGAQKTVNRSQDLLSGKEVMEKSNEGINEVQGAADADQMKRPSNSQGETIEGDIGGEARRSYRSKVKL